MVFHLKDDSHTPFVTVNCATHQLLSDRETMSFREVGKRCLLSLSALLLSLPLHLYLVSFTKITNKTPKFLCLFV